MTVSRGAPIGVRLLQKCFSVNRYRRILYQSSVLFLTFVAYTASHMSRRPLAVVKSTLSQDCSKLTPPPNLVLTNDTVHNWCNWAPFDNGNANRLLGLLDSVYVFAYAICMFFSGMLAERIDLRYFLSLGMLLSGFFTYLFGLAFHLNIHSFAFFLAVQVLAGIAQCTAWPGVVTCVANWFGEKRRGLLFGVWNAHVYIGNFAGAWLAGYFVVNNWGLSFIIPGIIVAFVGFILLIFLVPHPDDVDCPSTDHCVTEEKYEPADIFYTDSSARIAENKGLKSPKNGNFIEDSPFVPNSNQEERKHTAKKAISLLDAVRIPGVIEFSMCLFFSKLVSYTFLFWLPCYIAQATGLGSQASAYRSVSFEVGGILGGIAAGLISDQTGSSALTCVGFLGLAVPTLFTFEVYGGSSGISNIALQVICGALVNGPYALITTAVSAELGTHKSIKSNSTALSTVTAIIDGFGSLGAAVGPLIAGVVSEYSWSYVFYMMMLADFLALMSLFRTALKEFRLRYEIRCALPFVTRRRNGPYEYLE